jgi:hypothetical protein
MNERIKRLIEQATTKGEWSCVNNRYMEEFDKEKFAELIVQECIAQCEKNKDHEWLGSGSKLSAFNIKEHFGVEE